MYSEPIAGRLSVCRWLAAGGTGLDGCRVEAVSDLLAQPADGNSRIRAIHGTIHIIVRMISPSPRDKVFQ